MTTSMPEIAKTNGNGTHAPAAIVKAPESEESLAPIPSEADLETAVANIRALKANLFSGGWRLGKALGELDSSFAWKARKGQDGQTSAYKTFKEFCVVELGMTDRQARDYKDIARRFTETQFREIGFAKLAVVMSVPEKAQPALLDRAATASRAELATAAKNIRVDHAEQTGEVFRRQEPGRKGNAAPARAPSKKASAAVPNEKRKLTIAMIENKKHHVLLFSKMDEDKAPSAAKQSDLKAARKIKGFLDLNNKTRLWVHLYETPAGQLAVDLQAAPPQK